MAEAARPRARAWVWRFSMTGLIAGWLAVSVGVWLLWK